MNKIFFSVVGSMLVLFAWWTLLGYMQYGNTLVNHHLDLYTMVNRFKVDFNYTQFSGLWDTLVDTTKKVNDTNPIVSFIASKFGHNGYSMPSGFAFVLNAVNALLNPIAQIYNLFVIPVMLLLVSMPILGNFLQVTSAIVDFVISPVFI